MSSASRKRRKRAPRRPRSETPEAAPQAGTESEDKQAAAAQPKRAPKAPAQIEDRRPSAPWGSFPLVELVVFVALIMLAVGFFLSGPRGSLLLVTGLALGSLAGLELSVREHFGGFRSHTVLLAGAAGLATMLLLAYAAQAVVGVAVIAGAVVFGGCAWLLARAFRSRSGRLVKLR